MLPNDATCPSSIAIEKEDCEEAGQAVGGILNADGNINEGSWEDKPSGCSFDPIIHFNENLQQTYKLHFKTDSILYSNSGGVFEIPGYGRISSECHNSLNAECDIEIDAKAMDTLTIIAKTPDAWRFTISGDVGGLLDYKTVPGGRHERPFPTWMDYDQFDIQQLVSNKKL